MLGAPYAVQPKNGSDMVVCPFMLRPFDKDSVRTRFRSVHPLGESPFALSTAASAGVEGFCEFSLPFVGSFQDILDPQTGKAKIRLVDVDSEYYKIARQYMSRLEQEDFESPETLAKYAQVLKISPEKFREIFRLSDFSTPKEK